MNSSDDIIIDKPLIVVKSEETTKDSVDKNGNSIIKRRTPIRDAIIFSLIFIVVLIWSYSIYLWMICCFNWSTSIYKSALASVVAASIITIVAIIIVIVLSRLR